MEKYSQEFAATIFCGVGAHLGSARSQNAAGHILGHVRDVGADARDPNTRIYQTSERQTFHTDSSDVVGLLCIREAMEGGDSLLVSTTTIYNEMFDRRPDLAALLFDPIATDRRGEVPENEKPYLEIPVLNWHAGFLTGFYQRQYIDSAQRFPDAPRLTPAHVEALDLFDALANDPETRILACGCSRVTCSSSTIMPCCTIGPDFAIGPMQARNVICCAFGSAWKVTGRCPIASSSAMVRSRSATVAASLPKAPV